MRIGIDLDGVLVRFDSAYAHLITELNPEITFPVNDPNWPAVYWWERAAGVTAEQEAEVWRIIKASTANFWAHLPEYPETYDALRMLSAMRLAGHDVYFITTRPGLTAKLQTERWLMSRNIISPTVLISGRKGLVAAGLELDVFIDDHPENCQEVAIACPQADIYLPDRPYNRNFADVRVTRVLDVVEALSLALDEEKAA